MDSVGPPRDHAMLGTRFSCMCVRLRSTCETRRYRPDEIGYGGPHAALDIDLRHRKTGVVEALHERPIKLEELLASFTVHRERFGHVNDLPHDVCLQSLLYVARFGRSC